MCYCNHLLAPLVLHATFYLTAIVCSTHSCNEQRARIALRLGASITRKGPKKTGNLGPDSYKGTGPASIVFEPSRVWKPIGQQPSAKKKKQTSQRQCSRRVSDDRLGPTAPHPGSSRQLPLRSAMSIPDLRRGPESLGAMPPGRPPRHPMRNSAEGLFDPPPFIARRVGTPPPRMVAPDQFERRPSAPSSSGPAEQLHQSQVRRISAEQHQAQVRRISAEQRQLQQQRNSGGSSCSGLAVSSGAGGVPPQWRSPASLTPTSPTRLPGPGGSQGGSLPRGLALNRSASATSLRTNVTVTSSSGAPRDSAIAYSQVGYVAMGVSPSSYSSHTSHISAALGYADMPLPVASPTRSVTSRDGQPVPSPTSHVMPPMPEFALPPPLEMPRAAMAAAAGQYAATTALTARLADVPLNRLPADWRKTLVYLAPPATGSSAEKMQRSLTTFLSTEDASVARRGNLELFLPRSDPGVMYVLRRGAHDAILTATTRMRSGSTVSDHSFTNDDDRVSVPTTCCPLGAIVTKLPALLKHPGQRIAETAPSFSDQLDHHDSAAFFVAALVLRRDVAAVCYPGGQPIVIDHGGHDGGCACDAAAKELLVWLRIAVQTLKQNGEWDVTVATQRRPPNDSPGCCTIM
ncbi:hypothetical protein BC828DRAFT_372175 [Blastocladiella britannica]|nr:hypothetical protein BC828DRAFT_372175 [Blastocladiella britannica]